MITSKTYNLIFLNILLFFGALFFVGIGFSQSILEIIFILTILSFLISKSVVSIQKISFYFISFIPILNFSKGGFFSQNILSFFLILFISFIFLKKKQKLNIYSKKLNSSFFGLTLLFFLYYIFSFLFTGKYNINIRVIEVLFTALLIPIALKTKNEIKYFFLFFSINSILIFYYVLNSGININNRLMLDSNLTDSIVGGNNPINFGLGIAISFIFLLYNIKIKSFKSNYLIFSVIIFLSLLLILSTSRISLIVLFISILIFLFSQKQLTKNFFKVSIIVFCSLSLFLNISKSSPKLSYAYNFLVLRFFDSSIDDNKFSHGRLEQWQSVRDHFIRYPQDFIFGFGPGSQTEAHKVISLSNISTKNMAFRGKNFAFHSLILQIIVEIGIFSFLIFLLTYFKLVYYALIMLKKYNFPFPLIGIIGWGTIFISTSGLDVFSGVFLGLLLINPKLITL